MAGLDAPAVAALLDELGERLALSGASPFKVRAYHRAAEVLREQETPLASLVASGRLEELPGIGTALAEKISAFHLQGAHHTLDRLRREVPDGLLELARLPGLGVKRILLLKAQGIADPQALEAALARESLHGLKGFTPAFQARLRDGLSLLRASSGRVLLPRADALLSAAAEVVRDRPGVRSVQATGEARRRCETVAALRLFAAAEAPPSLPGQVELEGGEAYISVAAATPERSALALLYETGSEGHLTALEARARRRGLTLSGEGLSRGGEELPCSDESALYAALELPFIEPELREGRGEVEALGGEAPAAGPRSETPPFVAPRGPLLRLEDLRGTLHVHTTDSDGVHSLEEMAEAARALGLEYLGIADHSRSAAYAGGLSIGGLRAQGKTIDRLNARYAAAGEAFRVLKGVECDILRDGGLDYPDQVLAGLDFVVASVHSGFELEASKQTERLLRAIAHPATAVLGHPTGRLLLQRSGLTFDLPAILSACGARGVALELNAYPNRLDLDWRWHGAARAAGCRLAINPDAHTKDELAYVAYGVSIARKGGLTKADVLNAWPLDALRAHFAERRGTRTRLKGG